MYKVTATDAHGNVQDLTYQVAGHHIVATWYFLAAAQQFAADMQSQNQRFTFTAVPND